ncbi:MAG: exodeoxyribonuclease V subunit beta [Neisseria sp.]|nr:exodeoxyribonuclease V subunit beta [Neisseria sp.]
MTRTALPFAVLDIPIEGSNLIEASAGTGKTWNIAALFARLVVLERLPVDAVLVVTFTKAATAELKNRLRARLEETADCLAHPEKRANADPFLQDLLARAEQQESTEILQLRLKAALSQFDNAAIYTIHGFCQRVLRDYAFLCQVPFDLDLDEEQNPALLHALQDFWRYSVATDRSSAEVAVKFKQTPARILKLMGNWAGRPNLTCRRPHTNVAAKASQVSVLWQQVQNGLGDLERQFWIIHPDLNGNSFRAEAYRKKFARLHEWKHLPQPPYQELSALLCSSKQENVFAADYLLSKAKKNRTPDENCVQALSVLGRLYTALQEYESEEQSALAALQIDALNVFKTASAEQKKRENRRSYDDLLTDVHDALTHRQHADLLAKTVASVWKVALIDEFQDTDGLQYGIFRKIFADNGNPLFLVGDPKQAIYAFRGADIRTYLGAAADAQQHYTLTTNRRSHRALIRSINYLFMQKKHPFVLEGIGYPEVDAAREEIRLLPKQTAFTVRWLLQEGEKPNKDVLRRRSAEYCADEIAATLNETAEGRLQLSGKPLEAGGIAVLVRTHNEAKMAAEALRKRGVRSVLLGQDSVFASEEAQALSVLLGFFLEPRRISLLRFVLSGILFGFTADELAELNQNETRLAGYIEAAGDALAQWQQYGIYTALQNFDLRYGLSVRLLAGGKERSLSNFRQLAELLAAEDETGQTPAALQQWLEGQILHSRTHDASLLRLESDEALVKIVTMHAAKGLQYPLVFCPFAWDGKDNVKQEWQNVPRQEDSLLLHTSQLSEEDIQQLKNEAAGENLRLLYVALTRAEERLIIYAAPCKNTPANPFAYLLEGSTDSTFNEVQTAYEQETDHSAMLLANWQRFADNALEGCDIALLTDVPPPTACKADNKSESIGYQAGSLPERRFRFIRQTSFTGLTRNLPHKHSTDDTDTLLPVLDSAETAPSEQISDSLAKETVNPYSFLHFPRGTNAGVCLHELLEHTDFSRPASGQQSLFAETLSRYGFEDIWLPAVCKMADTVSAAPLPDGLTLAETPSSRRLNEMGFLMHMQDFNLDHLKKQLASCGLPSVCLAASETLDFATLNGFLNGFIDLTVLLADGQICITDYKSNHLGMSADDYRKDALDEAVAEHHYYLQALIYAVAAARYALFRRLPLHTVHIRYFFLRSMENGTTNGIWTWDIPLSKLAPWLPPAP